MRTKEIVRASMLACQYRTGNGPPWAFTGEEPQDRGREHKRGGRRTRRR